MRLTNITLLGYEGTNDETNQFDTQFCIVFDQNSARANPTA